jgi:hypothetical protein
MTKPTNTLVSTCTYMGNSKTACGHATLAGKSYCAEHYALVYKVGSGTRRKKDERVAQAVWSVQDAFNEAVAELEAEGFDCFGDSERVTA